MQEQLEYRWKKRELRMLLLSSPPWWSLRGEDPSTRPIIVVADS